jgi:hypothetical protein
MKLKVFACSFSFDAGRIDFNWGKSISRAIGRGEPWKSRLEPWNGKEQSEGHLGPKKSKFSIYKCFVSNKFTNYSAEFFSTCNYDALKTAEAFSYEKKIGSVETVQNWAALY